MVGDRERRLTVSDRSGDDLSDPGGTVQHRVLGVGVQMDERGAAFCCALALDHRVAHSLSTGAIHSLWMITTPLSLALRHDSRSGGGGGSALGAGSQRHRGMSTTLREMRDTVCMERSDLYSLFRRLAAVDGSDLHLKVGSPPRMRVNGELSRVSSRTGHKS